MDWHTASRAIDEIKAVDGRIVEKSTDGRKVIMREGTPCETLAEAEKHASEKEMAESIASLRSEFCGMKERGIPKPKGKKES